MAFTKAEVECDNCQDDIKNNEKIYCNYCFEKLQEKITELENDNDKLIQENETLQKQLE